MPTALIRTPNRCSRLALWMLCILLGLPCVPKSAKAEDSTRLEILQDSWQAARKRSLSSINEIYEEELKKLVEALTKEGKVDQALEAKEELDRITKKAAAATLPKKSQEEVSAFERWLTSVQFTHQSWVMTISGTTAYLDRGEEARQRWKVVSVDADKQVVIFENVNDAKRSLRISANRKYFNYSPDGGKTYTMTPYLISPKLSE